MSTLHFCFNSPKHEYSTLLLFTVLLKRKNSNNNKWGVKLHKSLNSYIPDNNTMLRL